MKRKTVMIRAAAMLLIVTMLLTAAACGNGSASKKTRVLTKKEVTAEMQDQPTMETVDEFNKSGGYMAWLEKYAAGPKEDLKGSIPVYREDDLIFSKRSMIFMPRDGSVYNKLSSCPNSTLGILLSFPTEAIRKRDDGSIYLIYDLDSGYRLCLILLSDIEYMAYSGFPVLIGEMKSYNDYSSIKAGSTIEELAMVDSAAEFYRRYLIDFWKVDPVSVKNSAKSNFPCTSVHYLSDGLLKIEYEMPEEGKLVISKIDFSLEYTFKDISGTDINYKILDRDLPE